MGSALQVLGLSFGIISVMLYLFAIRYSNHKYFKFASISAIAYFVLISIALLALLYSLGSGDFGLEYVARYTSEALPLRYKLAALWAGQGGSLFFWGWLVALFTSIELLRLRQYDKCYTAYFGVAALIVSLFLVGLSTFAISPFTVLDFIPLDGAGLNPLLQNLGMIIHPPLLYIGFAGFTAVFAHGFTALYTREFSSSWLKMSHFWTLFSWVFLTAGIAFGAWWAYIELDWGGYWAWDPVENASLFPWLSATAFIHAAMIFERRRRLKAIAYLLNLATLQLIMFGTYLTRSGIMADMSVHSFGDSGVGRYFIYFIIISSIAYLLGMALNRKNLIDEARFNLFSKEGAFFIGILSLMALAFAYLLYTMLPIITNALFNNIQVADIGSYNRVSIPFFIIILFLAGVAPTISYGSGLADKLTKSYLPSAVLGGVAVLVAMKYGYKNSVSVLFTFVIAMMLATFIILGVKAVKRGGIGSLIRQRRFFGGIIVHIGLGLMVFGIVYSALYSRWADEIASPSATIAFEEYSINVGELLRRVGVNYRSNYIELTVYNGDKLWAILRPEVRVYDNSEIAFGEVAYKSMVYGDFYVILQGFDRVKNIFSITIMYRPFIAWIWAGGAIMCLGGLYSASSRLRKRAQSAVDEKYLQADIEQFH